MMETFLSYPTLSIAEMLVMLGMSTGAIPYGEVHLLRIYADHNKRYRMVIDHPYSTYVAIQ